MPYTCTHVSRGAAASAARPATPSDGTPSTWNTVSTPDSKSTVASGTPASVCSSTWNVPAAASTACSAPSAIRSFGSLRSMRSTNEGSIQTSFAGASTVTDWFRSKSNSSTRCRPPSTSKPPATCIGSVTCPVSGAPLASRIEAGVLWPTSAQLAFAKSSTISACE